MGPRKIEEFWFSDRFKREYKRAQPNIRAAADGVFKNLMHDPDSHRCHGLKGYKPTVYVADLFPNHSWQITFEMVGAAAHLKRIATHSQIDRDPRG